MTAWPVRCNVPASSPGLTELHRPTVLGSHHDRSRFTCGDPFLDEWLRRYARQNRRGDTAATWVISDTEDRVVSYATLSMTAVDHRAAPQAVAKSAPDPVPALLIGRLATDTDFAGLGIATSLVRHLLATAMELNTSAACRAVVVTASNKAARGWWEHFGFIPFDEDPHVLDLYLLTRDIERTVGD